MLSILLWARVSILERKNIKPPEFRASLARGFSLSLDSGLKNGIFY
jgi:hypothetical protein